MTTKIKPSNVTDDTYIVTANNAAFIGGTVASEVYTNARMTITGTSPASVGATTNGHIFLVYQ